jgi:hypothetical protein
VFCNLLGEEIPLSRDAGGVVAMTQADELQELIDFLSDKRVPVRDCRVARRLDAVWNGKGCAWCRSWTAP